jgi:hypothetical protein
MGGSAGQNQGQEIANLGNDTCVLSTRTFGAREDRGRVLYIGLVQMKVYSCNVPRLILNGFFFGFFVFHKVHTRHACLQVHPHVNAATRLEGVVLGRNLLDEVSADDWDLGKNVSESFLR